MAVLSIGAALDKAWARNRKTIPLNRNTRLVIFSDLHRGTGDWADDFSHNSRIFGGALDYYLRREFTYIELGDGDELYENRRYSDIVLMHGDIFRRLQQFCVQGRLIYLLGNHNQQMADPAWRAKALAAARVHIPGLFQELEVHRTARLGDRVFLFHGHQGDFLSSPLLEPLGRFLVRYLWKFLQANFGLKDPTSAAQNVRKRSRLENAFTNWAKRRGRVAVSGHTHRPMFLSLSKQQKLGGKPEMPFYFNPGSGVHPRCVTCLEVKDLSIALVKWQMSADGRSRSRIDRRAITGCRVGFPEIMARLDEAAKWVPR